MGIVRQTYAIDAQGKILGKLAVEVALLLRGKEKIDYQSHLDNGCFVVVKNVNKMKFTGKKMEQKVYKHHTNFLGHLKISKMKDVYEKNPEKVFERAVYHMLPKNKLRPLMMKRLSFG